MTTSPDTVHGADATTDPAPLAADPAATRTRGRPARPDFEDEPSSTLQRVLVGLFGGVPLAALVAAIPLLWGWGLGWHDVVIAAVFYWVSGLGVTVGFHRYFTHSSFKAKPGLRVALAIAGTLAMEGPVVTWVADHRRHHKYSDKEGDPHSPWKYGNDARALAKGLLWGHGTWVFDPNQTCQERSPPSLLDNKKARLVDNLSPAIVAFTLIAPAVIGGFWTTGAGV